jgi:RNA polymerase sigma-70 factor (ECF subfamily)
VRAASLRVDESTDTASTPVPGGFAELYARHYEAVFRAALRVTGHPADAEDALRVLARGEHDEATRHPAAYFRRAAVNAAVDLLRRRAARGEGPYDEGTPEIIVERPALLKEQLRRAVATLQKDDASLFLLRHVEGLSIEELAGVFGLEKNNVAVRLHRIRLRLQTELER